MISLGLVDLIWTSNMILSHGHGHIFPCISMYSDWWSHYQLDKSIRWWSTATAFGGWWTPPYLPQLSWWWGPWVQERALSLRFRLVRNMKLWGKRRWFQRLELHNCWAEINPILRFFSVTWILLVYGCGSKLVEQIDAWLDQPSTAPKHQFSCSSEHKENIRWDLASKNHQKPQTKSYQQ